MPFQIYRSDSRSILSPVTGFLRDAGFTHSLSPSRNCTFGCSYCYVPTMRIQAGLRPDDWMHWGQWTTFKSNAAALLKRELRPGQIIYCSPLTDPYQPAEEQERIMRGILEAVAAQPPKVFVIQTRGPLILRDLETLRRMPVRVSFSITTNDDAVRQTFEPHCASIEERFQTIAALRESGIEVVATLAPLLPCDPEVLLEQALAATSGPVIVDPFHVRAVKRCGATTRDAAIAICERKGWAQWMDPAFQRETLLRMTAQAQKVGRVLGIGSSGFGLLARPF